ncbi:hypothetical protein T10_5336 [Trichinella papuae]|uniref:Uncharacterized protein n=1 Tax=Trichinella papuae TaxID=268474 RepID=A0A0V1MBQ2_9BILA|nr:hypothetical protein T10_5336 [Trichinella papuae]
MANSKSSLPNKAEAILPDCLVNKKRFVKMKKKANGGKFTLADLIEELKSPPNEQTVSAPKPFDNAKNVEFSQKVTKDLQELNLKLCELLKKREESSNEDLI